MDGHVPREVRDPLDQEALERLGRAVRAARQAQGLTQMRLERRTGVDQTTISRIERGLEPGLALVRLARICTVLRLPAFELPDQKRRIWPEP